MMGNLTIYKDMLAKQYPRDWVISFIKYKDKNKFLIKINL
jgi:hypothetical protein